MKSSYKRFCGLTLLMVASTAFAHVGSPDVYLESDAGPYHVLVTVNPPAMIPGVAQVQARVTSGTASGISIAPVFVTGKDQGLPPSPDAMVRSAGDPRWFTGKVWLMDSGAWEIRVVVDGAQGTGKMAVPVPAYARRTLPMERGLEALLVMLMLGLSAGIVSIAGAAAREGGLAMGRVASVDDVRIGRTAMAIAASLVVAILMLGNWWWNAQAADLKQSMLYSAPPLSAAFNGKDQLTLHMDENFWHKTRTDQWSMNLVPDHGHLMHAFLLRVPQMDRFYHLHPKQEADGTFTLNLPAMPAGDYRIFADIVRSTGFPETMVTEIHLPDVGGGELLGDDSEVSAPIFDSAAATNVSLLRDGGRMIWERDDEALKAGQVSWFRFRTEDSQQHPVSDLEPYMGMAGHAEFVRTDMSVFAHIHPAGSVPMASLMIAQENSGLAMDHGSMGPIPAEISFPYGFPRPGDYRLFVQVKRHGQIETGVFDTHVGS